MKRAGGNTAAGIAAFAASTGVSHATAQRVVYAVAGTSPSGKPAPPQASAASASKSAAARPQLTALAASAGISVSRLQAGLVAAKRAGGNTAASIAAFAASTGVSHATAQRVVYAVTGK
jgi:transposase